MVSVHGGIVSKGSWDSAMDLLFYGIVLLVYNTDHPRDNQCGPYKQVVFIYSWSLEYVIMC